MSDPKEAALPRRPPARPRRESRRRKSVDRKLRILDQLTAGLGVAKIARVEGLSVQRVRQIIAETLERREIDPPAGFVQLQVARLGEAMVVAHDLMLDGDLKAMDRFIKLTSELDRYHGFARAERSPATEPLRLAGPAATPLATAGDQPTEKIFLPAKD